MVALDVRHYYAILLFPDYRGLQGCSNDENAECHNYIRQQLKLIDKVYNNKDGIRQQKKQLEPKHSFILDEVKDDPNALDLGDNESDDDYDAKSIKYSLLTIQADVLMFWKMLMNYVIWRR